MVPLQMGIPGGPELLVVLLVSVLLFAVPVGLVVLLVARSDDGGGDGSLEARVERLEARVERLEDERR